MARVTLENVAERARVSRATASLVLRGSPLVADETRERVLASMRQLGYVYHRAAASLRSQRTHTVGLVINDITNPFFAELTTGVEAALDEAGYVLVLGNTAEQCAKQDRLLSTLQEYNADGLLLCPAEGTAPEVADRLHGWRLPYVLIARYLQAGEADYAGADNCRGAALGAEHLIAHGHRRIAFVGGAETSSARHERIEGYRQALERHELCAEPALTPACVPTRDGGYEAIRGLLALAEPPTAALCYNDVVAFGVMLGIQSAGQTPGEDFAVVGFDGIAEAAQWHPGLTTLSLAPRDLGGAAAQLLLERIAQPDAPIRHELLAPSLVLRASCGEHEDGAPQRYRDTEGHGG